MAIPAMYFGGTTIVLSSEALACKYSVVIAAAVLLLLLITWTRKALSKVVSVLTCTKALSTTTNVEENALERRSSNVRENKDTIVACVASCYSLL